MSDLIFRKFFDAVALALVQESQDKHSAEIVEKLLLNTEGANPQTFAPKHTVGWTWGDFLMSCVKDESGL